MKIQCVWEHNGNDTLLYAANLPGAYTRGETRQAALVKMEQEAKSYLRWAGMPVPEALEAEIIQEASCDLQVRDADSDVLFDMERGPLSQQEYEQLKALVLKSAEDFLALYESVPDKTSSNAQPRATFYGQVPRTAAQMYDHTKNVNAYYFGEIGVEADNEGTIVQCRIRGFQALERKPDFLQNQTAEGSWGESWNLRKMLRRFLWHDRIHAKAMYRMAVREFPEPSVCNPFCFRREITGSVTFHRPRETEDSLIQYAVVAARYRGEWLLCRHRRRTTWEIPGGHREPGETPEDTARRELWEETGATDFELKQVCVYAVNREGVSTYGMLYFAQVNRPGPIPDGSEMGEWKLFDTLPENLTYPDIQPLLYEKVQGWLNVQTGEGELWDVYDEHRRRTGRLHRRGDDLGPGDYHLVVHIWIENRDGQFLMTKRSPNKGYPNRWETPGGSALAGEDSLTAALREVKEETGLNLDPARGRIIHQYSRQDDHTDVWLFRQQIDPAEVSLQEGETCGKRLASCREILQDHASGKTVPYCYLEAMMRGEYL